MFRNKELFLTGRGKSIMDVEMEKRKFLNYLLSNCTLEGEKVSYNYNLPFSYFVNFDSCRKKYAIQVMKTEN